MMTKKIDYNVYVNHGELFAGQQWQDIVERVRRFNGNFEDMVVTMCYGTNQESIQAKLRFLKVAADDLAFHFKNYKGMVDHAYAEDRRRNK